MKIHSMTACACWNWSNTYPPNIRDEYRCETKRVGHVAGCARHPATPRVSRVEKKPPVKFDCGYCCQACAGQAWVMSKNGHQADCPNCMTGQRPMGPNLREMSLSTRMQRHDVNTEWRKWKAWDQYGRLEQVAQANPNNPHHRNAADTARQILEVELANNSWGDSR